MSKGHHVEFFGATDVGCTREINEDAFGMLSESGLFVVCDGMGGGAAGEVASSLATDSFLKQIRQTRLASTPTAEEVTEALRAAALDANGRVLQHSRLSAAYQGMGTTLVAIWIRKARVDGRVRRAAWLVHAGDSRCYRWREGTLDQMTVDHSLVEQQVRLGQMTAEEAEHSNMRHVITRAVGVDSRLDPELAITDTFSGDIFLLCSDGLTREVTDARIAELLKREMKLEDACRALIGEALANGGNDNVTCVLVRVG